jgi:hypothetical protein
MLVKLVNFYIIEPPRPIGGLILRGGEQIKMTKNVPVQVIFTGKNQ